MSSGNNNNNTNTNIVSIALRDVENSTPSIQYGASCMMKLYDTNTLGAVTIWRNCIQNCTNEQLLPLLYVSNEVIQTSKRNRGNKFLEAFGTHLLQSILFICNRLSSTSSSKNSNGNNELIEKIRRVVKIWGDRQIYSYRFVNELLTSIEPFRKNNTTTTTNLQQKQQQQQAPVQQQQLDIPLPPSPSPSAVPPSPNDNSSSPGTVADTSNTAVSPSSSSKNNESEKDNNDNSNTDEEEDDIMEILSEREKKKQKLDDLYDEDYDDDDDDDDVFGNNNDDSQRSSSDLLNIDIDNVVSVNDGTTITHGGNMSRRRSSTVGGGVGGSGTTTSTAKRRRSSINATVGTGSGNDTNDTAIDTLLGTGVNGIPYKLSINHLMELFYRLIQLKQQSDLALISINQIKLKIGSTSTSTKKLLLSNNNDGDTDGSTTNAETTSSLSLPSYGIEMLQNLVGDDLIKAKNDNDTYIQQLLQYRKVLYDTANEQYKIETIVTNYYINYIQQLVQYDTNDIVLCTIITNTLQLFKPIHTQITIAQQLYIHEQYTIQQKQQIELQLKKEKEEQEHFKRVVLAKTTEAQPGMVWNPTTREYQSLNTDESWRD